MLVVNVIKIFSSLWFAGWFWAVLEVGQLHKHLVTTGQIAGEGTNNYKKNSTTSTVQQTTEDSTRNKLMEVGKNDHLLGVDVARSRRADLL